MDIILVIDNYDSFTFNLVQYLGELGADVVVRRNDEITINQIASIDPSHIVISPGPCNPNKAGISIDAIKAFSDIKPVLGVCLGHQSIGQAYGGDIVQAKEVMHGKTSLIHHNGEGVFKNIPYSYKATRYHSLVIDKSTLPDCFDITAWTELEDGSVDEIMGIRHKEHNIQGVQFHPESIQSDHGHDLLNNFLKAS